MSSEQLIERIHDGTARVGIVGMGYVGLPLAREFCRAGLRVLGFDVDDAKVDALNEGRSYIRHIPAALIAELRASGSLEATTDFARIAEVDAILICVPTPLSENREPDLSYVVGTARAICPHLRSGQLVVLESTTYPGTTQEILQPELEKSGLKCGSDIFVAYSPEREDPGNANFTTRSIPKVVGADDDDARAAAEALYARAVSKVVPVSSTQVAEACKILENIYRCVNIALVNELKMLFDKMGIDIWEVIGAAATKPFGFHPFYPGPGLGGHCIPIDPFYLSWKARSYDTTTRFIELAGEVNVAMPAYVVNRLMVVLNRFGKALKGSRILVLGMAYKPDVGDLRESPSMKIIELLIENGAEVRYNDPHIPRARSERHHFAMDSVPLTEEALASHDCVLIATDHSAYDYGQIVSHAPLVLDTRNATRDVTEGREKVFKA